MLLFMSIASSASSTSGGGGGTNPPHIVFMLGDEVGYNNVGWHSNITLSPRMDALAKSGIILERHCTCAVSVLAYSVAVTARLQWHR